MGLHNPVLFHYDVEWERQSEWEGVCDNTDYDSKIVNITEAN